jgi:predicted transcriptional regulator
MLIKSKTSFSLKIILPKLPLKQKGLADIANINQTLISQYAHGVKKPGTKQLKRIKTALHKFADDLDAISF